MLGPQVDMSMGCGYEYRSGAGAGHNQDTPISTHTYTQPMCCLCMGTIDPQQGTKRESSRQVEGLAGNESRGQAKASTVLNTSDTAVMGNGNGTGAMLEMRDTVQLGALQTGRTH